jgi:FKBP-type peptidyl-prolyl cis-trans isomerase FklB
MKLNWTLTVILALLAASAHSQETEILKTDKAKLSYGLGVDLARSSARNGVEIDPEMVLRGIKDALSGEKLLVPEQELRRSIVEAQAEMRQRQARYRSVAGVNHQRGEAFMAENQKKEGVAVLPNGVQYRILKAGDGRKPAAADTVSIAYRGTLLEGTEVVASKPDMPATLVVQDAFLPALKDVLPLMPVGSKWRLWVPPQLAYGDRGAGRQIGPKETIVLDVDLLTIKQPE